MHAATHFIIYRSSVFGCSTARLLFMSKKNRPTNCRRLRINLRIILQRRWAIVTTTRSSLVICQRNQYEKTTIFYTNCVT